MTFHSENKVLQCASGKTLCKSRLEPMRTCSPIVLLENTEKEKL